MEAGKPKSFITVVIKLTNTNTSMQVAGYNNFIYNEIGSGAVFYSQLWHKSIYAEPGTIKISFFCKEISRFKTIHRNNLNVYPNEYTITAYNRYKLPLRF